MKSEIEAIVFAGGLGIRMGDLALNNCFISLKQGVNSVVLRRDQTPWNAGKALSQSTRRKISQSKKGSVG